jgi:hypothetical protein
MDQQGDERLGATVNGSKATNAWAILEPVR